MTGLDEVRAALAGVVEQVRSAHRQAAVAQAQIGDAVAVLTRLGEQHHESLVPVELRRAADELERGLGLIDAGAGLVADIEARL